MKIRALEPEDAPAVASLWQYWFRDKTRVPEPGLTELVTRIYVDNPGIDDTVKSLVAVDDRGGILGFLGVSVTPIIVDGRVGKMAGVFPSVVDPNAPTSVATFLLRKLLAGPQDFTFSDGGHVKFERIWELLGGRIMQLQSTRWIKVFRPVGLALQSASARYGPVSRLEPLMGRVTDALDYVPRRLFGTRLVAGRGDERYQVEELTPALLASSAESIVGESRLRPIYSKDQVSWQHNEMAGIVEQGEFRARLVRTKAGEVVGWYVYYLKPRGVSRLYDIKAQSEHLTGVLNALVTEADSGGAGALMGRMEPYLRSPLHRQGALLYNGGSLLMVHARDKTLVDDAELGRLAFSRLQGENWYWWAIISSQVP